MTPQEKAALRVVWGRGKPYKDLLAANLTIEGLAALQAAYKEHGLGGPSWGQRWRMWYISQYVNGGKPGTLKETYYKAGSLEPFLDVEKVASDPHWEREGPYNWPQKRSTP
jgi:hypothetical protein